nr:MAG TPA: hypothetical protein [Caudoviricetes sp.]
MTCIIPILYKIIYNMSRYIIKLSKIKSLF